MLLFGPNYNLNNYGLKAMYRHRAPLQDRTTRLSRDPGPVLVDIVLQWCKFLNKSAVNQIMYNQLTHSEPGALGGPSGFGAPGQLTALPSW